MNKQKGFTIIELIIVIAIIAVLAAIVLVNVTQYIGKSKDAAIEGNMSGLMTESAIFFETNHTYTGLCAAQFATGKPLFDQDPAAIADKNCNEASDGTTWAACSQLIATPADYWCVDSAGTKRQKTGTCDATDFTAVLCPS